jgi:hypothetical protein
MTPETRLDVRQHEIETIAEEIMAVWEAETPLSKYQAELKWREWSTICGLLRGDVKVNQSIADRVKHVHQMMMLATL